MRERVPTMVVTPVYPHGVETEEGVLAGRCARWRASPGDDDPSASTGFVILSGAFLKSTAVDGYGGLAARKQWRVKHGIRMATQDSIMWNPGY